MTVNVPLFMLLHFTASVMLLTLAALGYMIWLDYFAPKKKSRKRDGGDDEYDEYEYDIEDVDEEDDIIIEEL